MSARSFRGTRAALVLATIGALTLAGCGGGDDPTTSTRSDLEVVVNPSNASQGVSVPERRFFAADSPWNVRIDGSDVDPRSSQMISLARERVGVVQRAGSSELLTQRRVVNEGVYINTERWTTAVVAGGEPTKLVCRQLVCGDGADTTILNIPSDVDPDPRYDGWFTIFDISKPIAYDLWRARREDDGTISYQFMRKWDLDGSGFQAPQTVSARGSGLPLFAGLLRPKELQAGLITHALAISVPGPAQGVFVKPASSTDGNGRLSSLPEGARIRLKANVTVPLPTDPKTGKPIRLTAQQRRMADAIVAALRTYGGIVVDRAAVPTLYAQRDVTSDMIAGNELAALHLDDFEVVKLSPRIRLTPGVTAAPSAAATASASASASASPSASASTKDQ
ncbi:hypothetical protein [Nocardioides sp. URHA0020]|uniref:hypothetical protein n=1 Tax=Nocardioides sp. URHA0020 TaxID=1380392 RepID=UPI00048AB87E|nr:hypothetical protein [Nocardioides sp. URHA0020]